MNIQPLEKKQKKQHNDRWRLVEPLWSVEQKWPAPAIVFQGRRLRWSAPAPKNQKSRGRAGAPPPERKRRKERERERESPQASLSCSHPFSFYRFFLPCFPLFRGAQERRWGGPKKKKGRGKKRQHNSALATRYYPRAQRPTINRGPGRLISLPMAAWSTLGADFLLQHHHLLLLILLLLFHILRLFILLLLSILLPLHVYFLGYLCVIPFQLEQQSPDIHVQL